ncbi:hypothetical protein AVEN_62994-1 [Araneus ventricosus]|uniref:Uncharacterized protein n=1 Tax=Araneus ventricosus TaxID=182803 RepID=A0A4Y2CQQ5_ARAVE|nr:hypothetical protein AVEN_62994-1 [Araneus ventricosus]
MHCWTSCIQLSFMKSSAQSCSGYWSGSVYCSSSGCYKRRSELVWYSGSFLLATGYKQRSSAASEVLVFPRLHVVEADSVLRNAIHRL